MTPALLCLPLALTGPAEPLVPFTVLGITARTTPLKYDISLSSGLTARGKLFAFGGAGEIGLATGLAAPRQVDVTLTDLDAAQVGGLVGDALPAALRDRLRGRIGRVTIQVRGNAVMIKAEKFRLTGDWLTRAEGTADLKTRKYALKLYAFGGLLEAEGTLPEELAARMQSGPALQTRGR